MKKKTEIIETVVRKLPKTVSSLDNVLSTVVDVFDMLLTPFQIAKIYKDSKLNQIRENISLKAKSIPEEQIKEEADLTIVGPALEALKYTILNDDLTEMFENLLAASLDKRKTVFPSFVDIIRQINSDEAKLLKYISSHGQVYPLINLLADSMNGSSSYAEVMTNFTNIGEGVCERPDLISTYLVDLSSFGLIEISNTVYLSDKSKYTDLENHKTIIEFDNSELNKQGYKNCRISKGMFSLTEYGIAFIEACVTKEV